MPTISVIIPAYNAERTIVETIESVRQQTFSNFEIVVINDGSTDRTLELLNTVEDTRLKIFSYENGGNTVARNRGISHSTGEFITFIDADDLWTIDKLELQLAALQEHPKAGVAYSWTCNINESGDYPTSVHPNAQIFFEGNVYDKLLVRNFLDSGSNALIRREAIESIGEFYTTFKYTADWDFYIRLAERFDFVVVSKPQIFYRQSSSTLTSKVKIIEKYNLLVHEKAFKSAPRELQYLKNQSLANIYQYLTQLCLQRVPGEEGVKGAIQNLWKAVCLYPQMLLQQHTRNLIKMSFKKLILVQLKPQKYYSLYLD